MSPAPTTQDGYWKAYDEFRHVPHGQAIEHLLRQAKQDTAEQHGGLLHKERSKQESSRKESSAEQHGASSHEARARLESSRWPLVPSPLGKIQEPASTGGNTTTSRSTAAALEASSSSDHRASHGRSISATAPATTTSSASTAVGRQATATPRPNREHRLPEGRPQAQPMRINFVLE
ncbi:hypothetical protein BKA66DRAFT_447175 [Pyrenochaeta sp. MPI-SDFR-AT-0127]|nr:hypothetical protein BKA66DRAFT_447175 [Pyrenochaeta sp. MPI-SDFR-AT-0127]